MARPLRIQAEGLTYHVTARGTGKMAIFRDDRDRIRFLGLVAEVAYAEEVSCHAYCLMPNHYHLVVTTAHANLSRAFKDVNGRYAQWWNHRHQRVGHVFQSRFWAQVVQHDAYLATVCRYVVLNPVRAGLVERPEEWRWSSYRATAGLMPVPRFLTLTPLLANVGRNGRRWSVQAYVRFVAAGLTNRDRPPRDPLWGDDAFVARFRPSLERADREIPLRTTRLRRSLSEIFEGAHSRSDRLAAMEDARRARHSVAEIARHLGLHPSTVSKALAPMRGVRS